MARDLRHIKEPALDKRGGIARIGVDEEDTQKAHESAAHGIEEIFHAGRDRFLRAVVENHRDRRERRKLKGEIDRRKVGRLTDGDHGAHGDEGEGEEDIFALLDLHVGK